MKYRSFLAASAFCLSFGNIAHASALCTESIVNVILHTNGNIYFMTDKTCSGNWCQLNLKAGDVPTNKNAYAMLLMAKAMSKPINFQWDTVTDCTQQNPVYASPAFMVFTDG